MHGETDFFFRHLSWAAAVRSLSTRHISTSDGLRRVKLDQSGVVYLKLQRPLKAQLENLRQTHGFRDPHMVSHAKLTFTFPTEGEKKVTRTSTSYCHTRKRSRQEHTWHADTAECSTFIETSAIILARVGIAFIDVDLASRTSKTPCAITSK